MTHRALVTRRTQLINSMASPLKAYQSGRQAAHCADGRVLAHYGW